MDVSRENTFNELIMRHLQGDNSPQEMQQLIHLLNDDPEAIELYVESIMQYAALTQPGNITLQDIQEASLPPVLDASLWGALAEYEKDAPAIEIENPVVQEPRLPMLDKSQLNIPRHPAPSRRRVAFSLGMAASFLLVVGYLHFLAPNPVSNPVVATLADSIDAVWDNELQLPDGLGDMVQSKYGLKKGYASIHFNDGALVTVQAPTELSLNSAGDMELFSGKMYAIVPRQAQGFTVKAVSNKIVDLGTEFGVEVENTGSVQLHVTKGRTFLFAGLSEGGSQINVDAGDAKKVYNDGFVKDIPIEKAKFARRMNSESNLIIRDDKLDLADMVGGGNGFGTGKKGFGISLANGKYIPESRGVDSAVYNIPFLEVGNNPYIDSVFIPDGKSGDVLISSAGTTFSGFINTSGINCHNIYNQGLNLYYGWTAVIKTPTMMDGIQYGNQKNSAIFMHSNGGITFDLAAIRKELGDDVVIAGFKTRCGIPDVLEEGKLGYADLDFWVLVDGQEKFKRLNMKSDANAEDVEISLTGQERFLTLAVTDGGGDYRMDLALFGDPVLLLTFYGK